MTARRHAPQPPRTRSPLVLPLAALCIVAVLVSGVLGGLLRTGVVLTGANTAWLARAAVDHAALMICAFMGTLVGVERCVALKWGPAWAAPLASLAGGVALLLGARDVGAWLLAGGAAVFVAANLVLVQRQRAAHTFALLAGASCWAAGSVLFALDRPGFGVVPWWFAFLILTVAAERLEMTRLMRRRQGASASLALVLALLVAGALACSFSTLGGAVYGTALAALALWLVHHDVARRTVRADGLPRYMAVCLLAGYFWLAVAGIAWAGWSLGEARWRDAALHALGLGFVFSMMLGHAPVILPAIARVKLQFGSFFYVPLAALHLSLALRLFGGAADAALRAQGALLNAAALVLFAATVAGAALAWRRRQPTR